jgi:putative MFS transporter
MDNQPPSPALLLARLQRIPTTWHSWVIVLLAAGALVIEALNIGSLSITLPIIRKTMALTPRDTGMLAASSALGIVVGMIPTGYMADRFGRKRLLIFGVVWFAGGTAISAFSPNLATLVILRGLTGFGMAPAFIMPYTLTSEIVSATTRTAFAGLLETALGIGYLLPPTIGMAVIPHFAPEVGWRVFTFLCGVPVVYVVLIWKFLPESPRWLHRVGRYHEADRIICRFEDTAERKLGARLPLAVVDEVTESASVSGHAAPKFWWSLGVVWTPPYLFRTIVMTIGAMSLFSMFYISVNYLPSIFIEKRVVLESALFLTLITTATQIPWKIMNGIAAEHFGRKKVFFVYTVLAAISTYEFTLAQSTLAMVLWGMVMFSSSGASPSFKMWYAEQYPTRIRATGQSVVEGLGGRFFGGVVWTAVFPVLRSNVGLHVSMMIGVAIMIAGMLIVTICAPETANRTVESLEAA